jgi:hypothetical protein
MKDIKRLNDTFVMNDLDRTETELAVEIKAEASFIGSHMPVICIFPGQFHSDLPEDHGQIVFHHNLKIQVIPSEPTIFIDARETAGLCASCDKSVACLGARCAITRANSEIDALPDDDDLDIHFHGPDSAVTDLLDSCDDCPDAGPDSCDVCQGNDKADTGSKGEDDSCEVPEPSVFDKLKDEHWKLLSRWTVAAPYCHAQRDFKDDLDKLCRISGDYCEFDYCPRINDHHAY